MSEWARELEAMGLDPDEVVAYEQGLPVSERAPDVPPTLPERLWTYLTRDTLLAGLVSDASRASSAVASGVERTSSAVAAGAERVAADPIPNVVVPVDWRAVVAVAAVGVSGLVLLDLVLTRGALTGRALDGAVDVAGRRR
jgi:hypothetical protein